MAPAQETEGKGARAQQPPLSGLEVIPLERFHFSAYFDEPAHEFRGSTWVTPPRELPPELSPDEREMIEELLSAQQKLEDVVDYKCLKLGAFPPHEAEHDSAAEVSQRRRHFCRLTVATMRLVRRFFLRLRGFHALPEDQLDKVVQLNLKAALVLRFARKFDASVEGVRAVWGSPPYRPPHFSRWWGGAAAEGLFRLLRAAALELRLDAVEAALLHALLAFTEHPGLEMPVQVKMNQMFYGNLIAKYSRAKHADRLEQLTAFLHRIRSFPAPGFPDWVRS